MRLRMELLAATSCVGRLGFPYPEWGQACSTHCHHGQGRLAHRSLLCLLGLEEGELGEIKTRAVPGNSVTLSYLNFSCHLRD